MKLLRPKRRDSGVRLSGYRRLIGYSKGFIRYITIDLQKIPRFVIVGISFVLPIGKQSVRLPRIRALSPKINGVGGIPIPIFFSFKQDGCGQQPQWSLLGVVGWQHAPAITEKPHASGI